MAVTASRGYELVCRPCRRPLLALADIVVVLRISRQKGHSACPVHIAIVK